MEVFVGGIPFHLEDEDLEGFISNLVDRFGTNSLPSVFTRLPARPFDGTAARRRSPSCASGDEDTQDGEDLEEQHHLSLRQAYHNKGFFFKRLQAEDDRNDFAFVTFADAVVAEWFCTHAPLLPYSLHHHLRFHPGRGTVTKAFAQAIAENVFVERKSASLSLEYQQTYAFKELYVGYWKKSGKLGVTRHLFGEKTYFNFGDGGVFSLVMKDFNTTFLPSDVCKWASAAATNGYVMMIELRRNALVQPHSPELVELNNKYGYRHPCRVFCFTFDKTVESKTAVSNLNKLAKALFHGAREHKVKSFQRDSDLQIAYLKSFFARSPRLSIELAFHREALLRNDLIDLGTLTKIDARIEELLRQHDQDFALQAVQQFRAKLEARERRNMNEEQTLRHSLRLWNAAVSEALTSSFNYLASRSRTPQHAQDDLLSPMLQIDVTPTRLLLSGPHWHISNRVLRTYRKHWYHFARVTFTNEELDRVTSIKPNFGHWDSEVYVKKRILPILKYGFVAAGRKWKLLAWSSSSMGSHTAWFMTPFGDKSGEMVDADLIRKRLGDFSDVITSPARYGARLSQAFSATARTISIPPQHLKIIDDLLAKGNQIYTDGVGQISPELMDDVWDKYLLIHGEKRRRMLLRTSTPSAIQIRLGGAKGVLCVNPTLTGKQILLRQSMMKFGSLHDELEVCNHSSKCLPAKLNRPLINALQDLGVKTSAFMEVQEEAISLIVAARHSFKEAAKLCKAYGLGGTGNLGQVFDKLEDLGLTVNGSDTGNFFVSLAGCLVAAALGDIKRKARLAVQGVTLVGVADEFQFLKPGQIFVQVEDVQDGEVKRTILSGNFLIGRSPTLDPGDVKMVECVVPLEDHPLRKLRNVVVFNTCEPEQPLPRSLGGGDLDGDLYTVYDDPRIYPTIPAPRRTFYQKTPPKEIPRDCKGEDLAEFFADYILNDYIGSVSTLHLRLSDASDQNSFDPRCKELAELHSKATDFRKTGVPVRREEMPKMREPIIADYITQSEPREGKLVYASERALGHLYRRVAWDETDTPSLDMVSESGFGLVAEDEEGASWADPEDSMYGSSGESSGSSTPGSKIARHADGSPAPRQRGDEMEDIDTSDMIRDTTFARLVECVLNKYHSILNDLDQDPDIEVLSLPDEGQRYIPLFRTFTNELRKMSRWIASHHPSFNANDEGSTTLTGASSGLNLVSETHLLTGRLPWARVSKSKTEKEGSMRETTRALCAILRRGFRAISEASPSAVGGDDTVGVSIQPQYDPDYEEGDGYTAPRTFALSGNGSANDPYEFNSEDEDLPASFRRPQTSATSDGPTSSQVESATVQGQGHDQPGNSDMESAATPADGDEALYSDGSSTVQNARSEHEEDEDDFSVPQTRRTVSSLWKAAQYFTSSSRSKFTRVYGYNTFMITLVLYLTLMIDTLRLLEREERSQSSRGGEEGVEMMEEEELILIPNPELDEVLLE